ncbi:hypothetical protein IMZ48_11810 [Candidatus Bathyarchaeota archaeon]|nr:hypothetical protein [Candidatus Bathyarchaeota archaeon]
MQAPEQADKTRRPSTQTRRPSTNAGLGRLVPRFPETPAQADSPSVLGLRRIWTSYAPWIDQDTPARRDRRAGASGPSPQPITPRGLQPSRRTTTVQQPPDTAAAEPSGPPSAFPESRAHAQGSRNLGE